MAAQTICRSCELPAVEGKVRCIFCQMKHRERGLKLYHDRRAKGLCSKCSKDALPGKSQCEAHLHVNREKAKHYMRNVIAPIMRDIYDHYGGRCVCCGEDNPLFLTIDHINNDGYLHRRRINVFGQRFYKWIVANYYPDYLQLLCWNCNCGKNRNGGVCPHKTGKPHGDATGSAE